MRAAACRTRRGFGEQVPAPGGRGRVACASEARLSRLGTCARNARAPGRGCAQRVRRTARRHPSVLSTAGGSVVPPNKETNAKSRPSSAERAGGCPCRSGHSVPSGSHGGEPGAGGSRRAARLLCSFHRRRQFYRLAGDRTLAGLTSLIQRAAGPGPAERLLRSCGEGGKRAPHAAGLRSGRASPVLASTEDAWSSPGRRALLRTRGPAPFPSTPSPASFSAPAEDVVPLTPSSAMRRVGAVRLALVADLDPGRRLPC